MCVFHQKGSYMMLSTTCERQLNVLLGSGVGVKQLKRHSTPKKRRTGLVLSVTSHLKLWEN